MTTNSTQRLSITAKALDALVAPGDMRAWYPPAYVDDHNAMAVFDLRRAYEARRATDQFRVRMYGAAGKVVSLALVTARQAIPSGTPLGLAAKVGLAQAQATAAEAFVELQKHVEGQTTEWLDTKLKLNEELGKSMPNDKQLPPELRLKWLRDEGYVDELLETDATDHDRALIEGHALRALNERMNRVVDVAVELRGDEDARLSALSKQVNASARTIATYMAETEESVKEIAVCQRDISDRLDRLGDDVARNTEDLGFVKDYMFGQMSASEKIAALKSGFSPNMSQDERRRLEDQLQVVQRREELVGMVSTFANGAASLGRIAQKLGVDGNVVKAINQGAAIAGAAVAVATGIMSGGVGYLAAAEAVLGVLGGGDDAEAGRHQEIMASLGRIEQGVEDIKQMISAVSQQIEDLKRIQLATFEAIDSLAKNVERNQRDTMAELGRLRDDLKVLQDTVISNMFRDVELAEVVIGWLDEIGYRRDDVPAVRFSFERLCEIYGTLGKSATSALLAFLTQPLDKEVYALERFPRQGEYVLDYVNGIYRPLVSLALGDGSLDEATFASLSLPVSSFQALRLKSEALGRAGAPNVYSRLGMTPAAVKAALERPLSHEFLARHIGFACHLHPLFELRLALERNDPGLLGQLGGSSRSGLDLLRAASQKLEIAIAQQVLLSGDVLLPRLRAVWAAGRAAGAGAAADEKSRLAIADAAALGQVLERNRALERNLLNHAFRDALGHERMVAYAAAIQVSALPDYLQHLLKDAELDVSWDEGGKRYVVTVGASRFGVPTAEELVAGTILHSPALPRLLDLREQVLAEIAGFEVWTELTAPEAARLTDVLLRRRDAPGTHSLAFEPGRSDMNLRRKASVEVHLSGMVAT